MTRICFPFIVALVCLLPFTLTFDRIANAQQKGLSQPVRMGSGNMTFDTVPGWGLRPDGSAVMRSTHGTVVVDKAGNIYTSDAKGLHAFTPGGDLIRSYTEQSHQQLHDMEIRVEGGEEFIYGARNEGAEGVKFRVPDGEVVLKLPFPKESELDLKDFKPTAITVAENGDIFLANGYASNHIFKYDKTGKYLMHFGEKGNGIQQFNTAHGMTIDNRYGQPRLLICDRNHKPKGRLVHYDLEGNFIAEVITGLGMPTSVSIQGDYVSVPDLLGQLVILNKRNIVVAVLGHNSDSSRGGKFNLPRAEWIEGVFAGSHGSSWDAEGNLYVQDWNIEGRIRKLVRVK